MSHGDLRPLIRLLARCEGIASQLEEIFRDVDHTASAITYDGVPGSERATYWRTQLIRTANAVNFYTNLREGTWRVNLKHCCRQTRMTA